MAALLALPRETSMRPGSRSRERLGAGLLARRGRRYFNAARLQEPGEANHPLNVLMLAGELQCGPAPGAGRGGRWPSSPAGPRWGFNAARLQEPGEAIPRSSLR